MNPKSDLPRRRAMRLRGYDYSRPGAYFITTCVQHRKCLFGRIIDKEMRLSEIGQIVIKCWNRIPQHFPAVELGDSVIMPNHFHGIISWGIAGMKGTNATNRRGEIPSSVETNTTNRRGEIPSPTLGKIVAYFKYQSTKHINQYHNTPGTRIWQRNYYDHIIRDDPDLQRLRQYMQNNPMKWELDQLHPDNPSRW